MKCAAWGIVADTDKGGFEMSRFARFLTATHVMFVIARSKSLKIAVLLAVMATGALSWAQDTPDTAIAEKFLSIANQMRVDAGSPPLKSDPQLIESATFHLSELVKNETLASQYGDEPGLADRLRLAQAPAGAAGEVLLRVADLTRAADQVKNDPKVQKVLFNPKFTSAGFAAMHSGPWLYIVGDLVQPLKDLSMPEVENLVIEAVQQQRTKLKIAPYKVVSMLQLRKMACEMAKKDSLKATPVDPYALGGYIGAPSRAVRSFTYASADPTSLSDGIKSAEGDPKLNTVSAGSCLASSTTHPTGAYWVAMLFYNTR